VGLAAGEEGREDEGDNGLEDEAPGGERWVGLDACVFPPRVVETLPRELSLDTCPRTLPVLLDLLWTVVLVSLETVPELFLLSLADSEDARVGCEDVLVWDPEGVGEGVGEGAFDEGAFDEGAFGGSGSGSGGGMGGSSSELADIGNRGICWVLSTSTKAYCCAVAMQAKIFRLQALTAGDGS
jgi:hypothetical protein